MATLDATKCVDADENENGDLLELSVVVAGIVCVVLRFGDAEVSRLVISKVPESSDSEFILSMSSSDLKMIKGHVSRFLHHKNID